MKYKEAICQCMKKLAQDEKVKFLGYNVLHGSRAYGTLKDIPKEKCIETPLAENLMVGLATGLSLEGFKPVVYIERHDFILNALDGIVNHIDKIYTLSEREYKTPVLIRAVVGAQKPLYPGLQHIQDFSEQLKTMVTFPVVDLKNVEDILNLYGEARRFEMPMILIERRDLYDLEGKV
ncbi:MAG: hypothetical protein WC781_03635 [Candidatus Pacearchaeota archaeon]|jgi:pyruvate dehydrogenase E1 component beta subunit